MRTRLQFNRNEAAGALGDLGTFVPLLVGMVTVCGLQLGPTLITSGVANVVTGLTFGIPMPVQPMKAIAAVAIDEGLNEAQILTAGILTGLVILILGLTGLIDTLARKIPKSVIRGLQLALGLKLLTKGIDMIATSGAIIAWDSIAMGVIAVSIVLLLYFSRRFPGALIVFALGMVALYAEQPALFSGLSLGAQWQIPNLLNVNDWQTGLVRGAIPQIPLTMLNSVVAVCALSFDLFPKQGAPPRQVATSVGLMNLLCCPLGGMPVCHGAGGLAAQYRFGARSGGSVVMLGMAKIMLGLLFGGTLLSLLQAYPQSVLGALLLFGGLELALVCRDQTGREDFFVMLLTAGACLAINTAVGFIVGWLIMALLIAKIIRLEPPRVEDEPRP